MKLLATFALVAPALCFVGCTDTSKAPDSSSTPAGSVSAGGTTAGSTGEAAPAPAAPAQETPRKLVGGPMKDGEDVVVMETSAGKIVLRLFPGKAPKTVENFEKLVKKGFYDGIKFHRTIPGFMIQGGDPNTKDPKAPRERHGTGGPGYTIRDEINERPYLRGTVGMALDWRDTGGSQFFISLSPQPHLDAKYTVFGRVIDGMDVVDKIQQWDVIRRIRVWDGQTPMQRP